MRIIKILKPEQLDEFVLLSTFCLEGVLASEENAEWLKEELGLNETLNPIYTCSGTMVNNHYGLTGENAYPSDFPFLFIYDYYNVEKRIELGAQWFDVIVENNLINQEIEEELGYEE